MQKLLTLSLSAILLMMLSACSTKPVVTPPPVPPIPAHLLADCPQLPKLTSKLPSEERAHHFLAALAYSDCAAKHRALAGAVQAREASK